MANRRQNRGQKCPGSREIYRLAGQNTETHVKPLQRIGHNWATEQQQQQAYRKLLLRN